MNENQRAGNESKPNTGKHSGIVYKAGQKITTSEQEY